MSFLSSASPKVGHSRRRSLSGSVVLFGLAADTLIALLKFAAARQSGGTALFSEGIHSVLDVLTEIILLYGLAAASRPSDENFQLGYGRAAYFWNFVAAMLVLALGAGLALQEGLRQYADPAPLGATASSYAVLLLSLMIDGSFAWLTCRKILKTAPDGSIARYLRRTRDGATLTVLFSDAAAIVGLVIAGLGTFFGKVLGLPAADGVASIAIATIMALTALMLANQSRTLLIGASASPDTVKKILSLASQQEGVLAANGALSVRIGPDRLVVSLSLAFEPKLRTHDIEAIVVAIEKQVRQAVPQVGVLLVKPQSRETYAELQTRRGW